MLTMLASPLVRQITAVREGDELVAYQDQRGLWTIGKGHLMHPQGPECAGVTITQAQSDTMFEEDIGEAEEDVDAAVTVQLNQNQFDALVCWTFCFGGERLRASTLLRRVNAGDFAGAAAEFLRWDHETLPGGVVREVAALEARRREESDLFRGILPP